MKLPEGYLDHPLFEKLSDREKAVLNSNASLLKFSQDQVFINIDSLLFSTFYIYRGEVKIKDAGNRLCELLGTGDFIGLRYLYSSEPAQFTALAVGGTQIIQFEKNVLKQFASTNSRFLVDVYNKATENVGALAANLVTYKIHRINGAMADFLLYYGAKDCLQSLTQKEISEILGYSREIVWKCLKDFTQEGLIATVDGNIEILNAPALENIRQVG